MRTIRLLRQAETAPAAQRVGAGHRHRRNRLAGRAHVIDGRKITWHTTGVNRETLWGSSTKGEPGYGCALNNLRGTSNAGLAHVLATVAKPRSDDAASNAAFDAYVDAHRSQLIKEIDVVVASVNESDRALTLGGQVENVLDRAAEGLKRVAQKYGIDDVTERLTRLVLCVGNSFTVGVSSE